MCIGGNLPRVPSFSQIPLETWVFRVLPLPKTGRGASCISCLSRGFPAIGDRGGAWSGVNCSEPWAGQRAADRWVGGKTDYLRTLQPCGSSGGWHGPSTASPCLCRSPGSGGRILEILKWGQGWSWERRLGLQASGDRMGVDREEPLLTLTCSPQIAPVCSFRGTCRGSSISGATAPGLFPTASSGRICVPETISFFHLLPQSELCSQLK